MPPRADAPFLLACRNLPAERVPVWFMRQAGRSLPEYRALRGAGSILDAVRDPEPHCPWVQRTVRAVVEQLGDVPLIGFAGAPFTVASYLIEGGPSRTLARTKALMLGEPDLWSRLLDRLADRGVAAIHFGVTTGELLALLAKAGAQVVGVEWGGPLDEARQRLGPDVAVQGNLDPAVCLAPWPAVAERARDVLVRNGGRPGHIFNLGHGVLPETDPSILERLVELVHSWEPEAGR